MADDQPVDEGTAGDWPELSGKNLVALAGKMREQGRDWSDLHTLLKALPEDRWTTYGEIADAISSHAVPVGTHLARCTQCSRPWRVLRADGTPSPGFRWSDTTRTQAVIEVLVDGGVHMEKGRADGTQRVNAAALRSLAGLDHEP